MRQHFNTQILRLLRHHLPKRAWLMARINAVERRHSEVQHGPDPQKSSDSPVLHVFADPQSKEEKALLFRILNSLNLFPAPLQETAFESPETHQRSLWVGRASMAPDIQAKWTLFFGEPSSPQCGKQFIAPSLGLIGADPHAKRAAWETLKRLKAEISGTSFF